MPMPMGAKVDIETVKELIGTHARDLQTTMGPHKSFSYLFRVSAATMWSVISFGVLSSLQMPIIQLAESGTCLAAP